MMLSALCVIVTLNRVTSFRGCSLRGFGNGVDGDYKFVGVQEKRPAFKAISGPAAREYYGIIDDEDTPRNHSLSMYSFDGSIHDTQNCTPEQYLVSPSRWVGHDIERPRIAMDFTLSSEGEFIVGLPINRLHYPMLAPPTDSSFVCVTWWGNVSMLAGSHWLGDLTVDDFAEGPPSYQTYRRCASVRHLVAPSIKLTSEKAEEIHHGAFRGCRLGGFGGVMDGEYRFVGQYGGHPVFEACSGHAVNGYLGEVHHDNISRRIFRRLKLIYSDDHYLVSATDLSSLDLSQDTVMHLTASPRFWTSTSSGRKIGAKLFVGDACRMDVPPEESYVTCFTRRGKIHMMPQGDHWMGDLSVGDFVSSDGPHYHVSSATCLNHTLSEYLKITTQDVRISNASMHKLQDNGLQLLQDASYPGRHHYRTCVLARNGKIYAPPYSEGLPKDGRVERVLEIDTTGNVTTSRQLEGILSYGMEHDPLRLYSTSVLADNDKIYAAPGGAKTVLEIDPTVSPAVVRQLPTGISNVGAYESCVLAKNSKIYCPPIHESVGRVLEIDPTGSTVMCKLLKAIHKAGNSGGWLYKTSALANNGKIYAAPWGHKRVLEIDPTGSVAMSQELPNELFAESNDGNNDLVYGTSTLANNGKIYAAPLTAVQVLEIDPTVSPVACRKIGARFKGSWLFTTSILSQNGLIYAPPHSGDRVLEINPTTNPATSRLLPPLASSDLDDYFYSSCAAARNGQIYCVPELGKQVLKIDTTLSPATSHLLQDIVQNSRQPLGFSSCVLAPNGKIYAAPNSRTYQGGKVLEIDPEQVKQDPDTEAKQAWNQEAPAARVQASRRGDGDVHASPMMLFGACVLVGGVMLWRRGIISAPRKFKKDELARMRAARKVHLDKVVQQVPVG